MCVCVYIYIYIYSVFIFQTLVTDGANDTQTEQKMLRKNKLWKNSIFSDWGKKYFDYRLLTSRLYNCYSYIILYFILYSWRN